MNIQALIHSLIVNDTLLHVYSTFPSIHLVNQTVSISTISSGVYCIYLGYLQDFIVINLQRDMQNLMCAIEHFPSEFQNLTSEYNKIFSELEAANKIVFGKPTSDGANLFSTTQTSTAIVSLNKSHQSEFGFTEKAVKSTYNMSDITDLQNRVDELKNEIETQKIEYEFSKQKIVDFNNKILANRKISSYYVYAGVTCITIGAALCIGDWTIYSQTSELRSKIPEVVDAIEFKLKICN